MGLYCGTPVYSSLVEKKQKWKAYGERIMEATVQTSMKRAIQSPDKVTIWIGVERASWIAPASIWRNHFVMDSRYWVGHRSPPEKRRLQPRQKNSNFEQMLYPRNPWDIVNHLIMRLQALQNDFAWEGFYANYGGWCLYFSAVAQVSGIVKVKLAQNNSPNFQSVCI